MIVLVIVALWAVASVPAALAASALLSRASHPAARLQPLYVRDRGRLPRQG